MKNIREAAERCLATPSVFAAPLGDAMAALAELQRVAAALGPLIPLATELRAERDRMQAVLAQMQGEVARFRNAAASLEAMLEARNAGGQSEPRKCECPPGGLSVVLLGGWCAKCGGKA